MSTITNSEEEEEERELITFGFDEKLGGFGARHVELLNGERLIGFSKHNSTHESTWAHMIWALWNGHLITIIIRNVAFDAAKMIQSRSNWGAGLCGEKPLGNAKAKQWRKSHFPGRQMTQRLR